MGKPTPPLSIEARGPVRGRLRLRGVYASSRPGVAPHVATGRDDGTPIDCTCDGWKYEGRCWHVRVLAGDYFRSLWAGRPLAALERRARACRDYLAACPHGDDTEAVRLEQGAIGTLVGELTREAA